VLIELLVENRDGNFDPSDFAQPREGEPRDNWQVAWAEAYLSQDGESLLVERWGDVPDVENFRFAFFLHYYRPENPISTSYGMFECTPVEAMPDRLKRLVPFESMD